MIPSGASALAMGKSIWAQFYFKLVFSHLRVVFSRFVPFALEKSTRLKVFG